MSKLDWSKVGGHASDPAKLLRDRRDTELVNTPAARKEAKQQAKARSKAAKQAAATRKLNRQKQAEADRATLIDKQRATASEDAFWAKLKGRMAVANENRRARKAQTAANRNGSQRP